MSTLKKIVIHPSIENEYKKPVKPRAKSLKHNNHKQNINHNTSIPEIRKEFLQKFKERTRDDKDKDKDDVKTEFKESVEYLKKMTSKIKKDACNEEVKSEILNTKEETPVKVDFDDFNSAFIEKQDIIPYSNLKVGANKPTYKEWIDLNKPKEDKPKEEIDKEKIDKELKENIEKEKVATKISFIEKKIELDAEKKDSDKGLLKKKTVKYITKRKFTLGKQPSMGKITLLLKNKQTRKNIKSLLSDLKNTPIHEIKAFLRKRGIIKVGNTCPDSMLRDIYETTITAGDVYNSNAEILTHNFIESIGEGDDA